MENKSNKTGVIIIIVSSIALITLIILLIRSFSYSSSNSYFDDYSSNVENQAEEETKQVEESKNKVSVIDLSNMTKDEISTWCTNNKIKCNFQEEYSDTVENGKFISQNATSGQTITEGDTIVIIYSKGQKPSVSKLNAVEKAKSYLRYSSFSYKGLVEQLEFEQFSYEDAVYGVDNCGANWYEQAVKKAASYLKYSAFSHGGLVDQLEFEGFTPDQAEYGVTQNGL